MAIDNWYLTDLRHNTDPGSPPNKDSSYKQGDIVHGRP